MSLREWAKLQGSWLFVLTTFITVLIIFGIPKYHEVKNKFIEVKANYTALHGQTNRNTMDIESLKECLKKN